MLASEVVHVIDDDEGIRSSLCALLGARDFVAVPHNSCESFLKNYSSENTLCVVADLRMPGMGGLDLQDHLLAQSVDLPFIVITGHGDVPTAVRALKSGAADFIEKPIDASFLLAAIEKLAMARRATFDKDAGARLVAEKLARLTPREHEVLCRIVEGSPNKIIAYELNISPRTVENHRSRLMVKLQADSVAELVKLAMEAGITAKAALQSPVK